MMNEKQIEMLIKQLRQQLKSKHKTKTDDEIDKMILDMFFGAFIDDKISREDLCALTIALGYEPREDILDEIEKEKGGKH